MTFYHNKQKRIHIDIYYNKKKKLVRKEKCKVENLHNTKEKIKMNTYTSITDINNTVKDYINAADKNVEEYDIAEISREVSDYNVDEHTFYFNENFEDAELFWEIAEEYSLNKDLSDVTNSSLLDKLEDSINEEDEFTVEQLRKEILNRMSNNY